MKLSRTLLSSLIAATWLASSAQAQITPGESGIPRGPTDDRPEPTTEQLPLPPPPAEPDSRQPFPEREPLPDEDTGDEQIPPEQRDSPPETQNLPPETTDNTGAPENASAAAEVIGTAVKTPDGETIGQVQNVVLDASTGEATHAVVAHGKADEVLKLTAVPWETLQDMRHGSAIVMERVRLERAPSFNEAAMPDLSDPSWSRDSDRYWQSIRTASGESAEERR